MPASCTQRRGRKRAIGAGTYAIRVTDEAGDTAAVFQGLVYRKNTPVTEFLGR